jgi:toxin ParE1/3/4
VLLTGAAESDFERIIEWTVERFGEAQALIYAEALSRGIEALVEGPSSLGAKQHDEILKGLHSLHVDRQDREGRHFVMLRIAAEGDAIEVLRLLHDSMDLPRHLGDDPSLPTANR